MNQIWENKTKIASVQRNNGKAQAVIFKIKDSGLEFENIIKLQEQDLQEFLKKSRMKLTNKVLVLE